VVAYLLFTIMSKFLKLYSVNLNTRLLEVYSFLVALARASFRSKDCSVLLSGPTQLLAGYNVVYDSSASQGTRGTSWCTIGKRELFKLVGTFLTYRGGIEKEQYLHAARGRMPACCCAKYGREDAMHVLTPFVSMLWVPWLDFIVWLCY
jgi:hypothetical protein